MVTRGIRSGAHDHSSLFVLWTLFLFGMLLSGCAPVERQQARARAWWAEISGTASGAIAVTRDTVKDTVEAGRATVEGVQATVEDLQQRAAKVEEGAKKIQEGKKLIEEGVK